MYSHETITSEQKEIYEKNNHDMGEKCASLPQKNQIQNFLRKLYHILDIDEYSDYIRWGENGKYFVIINMNQFTDQILPRFYKHNNFSSFVRQLNMYDFHKKKDKSDGQRFSHKKFLRGQK